MYAKLIDGIFVKAPNMLKVEDRQIWNAPPSEYFAKGWKPVKYTGCAEAPDGHYYESGWEEEDNEIVQTWTLLETPTNAEEIVDILTGVSE